MSSEREDGQPEREVRSLLLLGAGELGKELAISAQRLGSQVIAADRYHGAPALQVAHHAEVVSLQDGTALEGVIRTHRPDHILPEVEHVGTRTLRELEADGFRIVPGADAVALAVNRGLLRDLAAVHLGIRTPRYALASTEEELAAACDSLGYPCIVKPLTSSSGKGLSEVQGPARIARAWDYAFDGSAEGERRVFVEELIPFDLEVTLLTLREWDGSISFLPPIAHRQERGSYRESWQPAGVGEGHLKEMQEVARRIVERLGGAGIFGIEFFLLGAEVYFSELSLGPHDTGFVTLVSQDISQFDLHLRALLRLPIPAIRDLGPSASAVILADREGEVVGYSGVERALQVEGTRVLLFGKPSAHPLRRMGVALASGESVEEARARAMEAAGRVGVICA
jgi:phosphoribosylglycinamide formyltransferase 2